MSIHPSTVYADPAGGLHGDEAAGAERDEPDLVDHRHQGGRDRGVHGGASRAGDRLGGVRGLVARGRDGEGSHGGPVAGAQRRVAMTADASAATITSTAVNRSSVSHCSRSVSTRP